MHWCSAGEWYGLMVFSALEEKFAQAVCFLLVDLYLLTFQPEKALHLLAMLEKLSVQGNNKNGKGEVRNKIKMIVFILCTFTNPVLVFSCFVPLSVSLVSIASIVS